MTAGDGLLRFGHQIVLVNNWTHEAKFTGEKSECVCCLATGVAHSATTNGGSLEVTATGTTMMRSTLRSAFIIHRSVRILFLITNSLSLSIDQMVQKILNRFDMVMKLC